MAATDKILDVAVFSVTVGAVSKVYGNLMKPMKKASKKTKSGLGNSILNI